MNPIPAQGSVPVTGGIMYTPPSGMNAEVTNIKISNTVASSYTVVVSRYVASLGTKVQLYSYSLNSGDSVNDTTSYQLEEGDYLYLVPSLSTVVFVITGLEY